MAIGKAVAKNAALFAVAVLALANESLHAQLVAYRERMTQEVVNADRALQESFRDG
jgi:5-(carboxyamino)imidazole ribonucleotide mutase